MSRRLLTDGLASVWPPLIGRRTRLGQGKWCHFATGRACSRTLRLHCAPSIQQREKKKDVRICLRLQRGELWKASPVLAPNFATLSNTVCGWLLDGQVKVSSTYLGTALPVLAIYRHRLSSFQHHLLGLPCFWMVLPFFPQGL
jgi:hypothetical protein